MDKSTFVLAGFLIVGLLASGSIVFIVFSGGETPEYDFEVGVVNERTGESVSDVQLYVDGERVYDSEFTLEPGDEVRVEARADGFREGAAVFEADGSGVSMSRSVGFDPQSSDSTTIQIQPNTLRVNVNEIPDAQQVLLTLKSESSEEFENRGRELNEGESYTYTQLPQGDYFFEVTIVTEDKLNACTSQTFTYDQPTTININAPTNCPTITR